MEQTLEVQNAQVFRLLVNGHLLTNADALNIAHIGRLAARISELRHDYGVPIRTTMVENINNSGRHAVYSMDDEYQKLFAGARLADVHERLAMRRM